MVRRGALPHSDRLQGPEKQWTAKTRNGAAIMAQPPVFFQDRLRNAFCENVNQGR